MADENILNKIRSLFALAEGAIPENATPAQVEVYKNEKANALKMAQKFLTKYNVDRSQITLVEDQAEVIVDLPIMGRSSLTYPFKKSSQWWKELAKVTAKSQFCRVIFDVGDLVSFCGLDLDRELAMMQFSKFAEIADVLCKVEMKNAKKMAGMKAFDLATMKEVQHPAWRTNEYFEESFHYGFRKKLGEILEENMISNAVTDKLNRDVENYYNLQISMGRNIMESSPRIPDFTHAMEMGEKVASNFATRIEKKNGKVKADALIRNSQIVQIKNVGTVILALDVSGSMSGDKLSQAKRGLVDYSYQAFGRGFKVGLVAFGLGWYSGGKSTELLVPPQEELTKEFTEIISGLTASGSTPMDEGIEISRQNLSKDGNKKRTICIITDGMPDNKERTLLMAQIAKDEGIEIMVIGTNDIDQAFADQLASKKGMAMLVDNVNFGEGIKKMALQLTA